MKLDISRADIWAASIKDHPGGLDEKLKKLAESGADLEFLIARRAPNKPGTGVVFVTPIKGAKQQAVAKKVGFRKSKSLCGIRIAATDSPGLGAKVTGQIAAAGISLRGASAARIGKKAIFNLAFDSAAKVTKAIQALKKL